MQERKCYTPFRCWRSYAHEWPARANRATRPTKFLVEGYRASRHHGNGQKALLRRCERKRGEETPPPLDLSGVLIGPACGLRPAGPSSPAVDDIQLRAAASLTSTA